jgi:tRNA threonylcarbamoyladenosine biosynthesis protein TsaE
MSTKTTYSFVSNSVTETESFARLLAARLRGGEVFVFKSDVGGGKTTFVRALVAALGSTDHVSSPTFTVSKIYKTPQFRIAHFDFYRLQDPHYVVEALQEEMSDPHTICFVEWPTSVGAHLPLSLVMTIQKDPKEPSRRSITLEAGEAYAYILEGLAA